MNQRAGSGDSWKLLNGGGNLPRDILDDPLIGLPTEPPDEAIITQLLADYGAPRLRRIAGKGYATLKKRLNALARAAALDDAEDCARLLHRLRMRAFDDGFRDFAETCRYHERRARAGCAPALSEVRALSTACHRAWTRLDRHLGALIAQNVPHGHA